MLTCFEDTTAFAGLDRHAFTFSHKLLGHPALSLENLARVLPGRSLEETIERIKTSNSSLVVRSLEVDASFKDLFRQLVDDVGGLMYRRGVGQQPCDPVLHLFIASPHALTPFHVERQSTFVLQFRGREQVAVFPLWDERVVPAADLEGFMAKSGAPPHLTPEAEALGTVFDVAPGQALHVPFMAGHWVKNGADDVSISLAISFNTRETVALSNAMQLNHRLRKLGLDPKPARKAGLRALGKSYLFRSYAKARRMLGR